MILVQKYSSSLIQQWRASEIGRLTNFKSTNRYCDSIEITRNEMSKIRNEICDVLSLIGFLNFRGQCGRVGSVQFFPTRSRNLSNLSHNFIISYHINCFINVFEKMNFLTFLSCRAHFCNNLLICSLISARAMLLNVFSEKMMRIRAAKLVVKSNHLLFVLFYKVTLFFVGKRF